MQKILTLFRLIRLHQWLKNFLLFVPLFASHKLDDVGLWQFAILAFFSFSLFSSSMYILNDLKDIEFDKKHPRKKLRPFASGLIPRSTGYILMPLLVIGGLLLGTYVNDNFLSFAALYLLLTLAYNIKLRSLVLVDCFTLAILYTLRIVAGAAAVGVVPSFWLLSFSIFFFLSLAFVKRYSELKELIDNDNQFGRGYFKGDRSLIRILGITSGYISVLVLALYLNSITVIELYNSPEILLFIIPLMLLWIGWVWLKAHRGEVDDDPIIFALKDKLSGIVGGVFIAILFFATF